VQELRVNALRQGQVDGSKDGPDPMCARHAEVNVDDSRIKARDVER
jgi:hypothetical protein